MDKKLTVQRKRKLDSATVNNILTAAETSSQAMRDLYKARKALDKGLTLSVLCKAMGLASTGYLSDVFSGKKNMSDRYISAFNAASKLNRRQAAVLRLLAKRDACRGEDRRSLNKKIRTAKSLLALGHVGYPENTKDLLSAIEVFCSLGLFQNRATLEQLSRLFENARRVKKDLKNLECWGVVVETEGFYAPARDHVLLSRREGKESSDYIRECLRNTLKNLDDWYGRKNEAYYESGFISVDKKGYQKLLRELQEGYSRTCVEYESQNASMVACYSIQIYPAVVSGDRS